MATKYAPLGGFLENGRGDRIPMTFSEIEKVLGFPLPASKQYPAWWSNDPSNNPMTRVWLEAGFVTEQVDTGRQRLTFRRNSSRRAKPAASSPTPAAAAAGEGWITRLRREMAGTVKFAPGFDPTAPTGERWDAEHD